MPARKTSEITLKIRRMARIERLKDKVAQAEANELSRRTKAKDRIDALRAELDALRSTNSDDEKVGGTD